MLFQALLPNLLLALLLLILGACGPDLSSGLCKSQT